MFRIRSQKLLSGVSTLAVIAGFGAAVDPVLAAGTTVTGPGIFVNIDTTVLNPPGTTSGDNDFIIVEADAIIGTDASGRSIFNPAAVDVGTGATAVLIDDSILQGSIVNNGGFIGTATGVLIQAAARLEGGFTNTGSIEGTTGAGINANASTWLGGLSNTLGTITGATAGVLLDAGTNFAGALNNTGTIEATSGTAIHVLFSTLGGGITNSGSVVGAAYGVNIDNGSLSGGLSNAATGTISGGTAGVQVLNSTWNGNLNNSGSIIGGIGLEVNNSAFNGGLTNTGVASVIGGTTAVYGIHLVDSTWNGLLSNSGSITGTSIAIWLESGVNFAGGISNAGSIAGAAGIVVDTSNVFTGGIINNAGGSIIGTTAAAINVAANTFSGGITNTGTIDALGGSAAIILSGNTFLDGITNNTGGLIQSASGTAVIAVSSPYFDGGIRNAGSITTPGAGMGINLTGANFFGGIDNTGGTITTLTGIAINVANTNMFEGGITNGSLISSTANFAINIDATTPLFEGGIHNNAGTIEGGSTAIFINNAAFLGGITNDGDITADNIAILSGTSNTWFDGGIANTGLIAAGVNAISIQGVNFTDGITNSATGRIESASGNAIDILNTGMFSGGIDNDGVIRVVDSGIAINTATTLGFIGGIDNSGVIQGGLGTTAIVIADAIFFNGGVNNTGTIESGGEGGDGINITAPTFTGGIVNDGGTITGFDTGIFMQGTVFQGGIVNSGLIASTGGAGFGIEILTPTFNGGIDNQAGGLIRGTTAIFVANTTFTGGITNAGDIEGISGIAIFVNTTTFTGGLNNTGTIAVTGAAGASAISIDATDFLGGIVNEGLIHGVGGEAAIELDTTNFSGGFLNTGTINSFSANAVDLETTTWTGDFVNEGLISGATDGLSFGSGVDIDVTNFNGSFVNDGTISGGPNSGNGVFLEGDFFSGDVVNNGLITAISDGLILEHNLYGGDVENAGKITALGTGILLNGGTIAGALINSGTIDPQYGIYVDGGAIIGGIFNSGVIVATSVAIDVSNASLGTTITQTAGLIEGGQGFDGAGGSLNLSNGFADTFIGNGGVLNGDIDADGGAGGLDNFIVGGPFTYFEGKVQSFNQLIFTDGPGAFGVLDVNADGFDDGFAAGGEFGSAADFGGIVEFYAYDMQVGEDGFAYVGDETTILLENDLNVIGSATGTIAFLLTPNTSSTAYGSIDAAGDVNFCASPSPLPGPFTCTPAATPGGAMHAVIDPVLFGQGVATDTLNYEDVITAAGSITNNPIDIDPTTPGVIDISTSSLFFQAHLESDGGEAFPGDLLEDDIDIVINRIDFGDSAGILGLIQTQNQQSIGNALEGIWDNGGPFSQQFQDLFALLIGSTDPLDVLFYYDELNGAEHAQVQGATLNNSRILNTFMQERLDSTLATTGGTQIADLATAERRYAQAIAMMQSDAYTTTASGSHGLVRGPSGGSAWMRVFGEWVNVDADPEAPGYDHDSGGLAAGVDYAVSSNATVGGALSYASGDADFDAPGSEAEIDSWQVGLYGNYGFGHFYLDGMASYAWHDVTTERFIDLPIPGPPLMAVADYDGDAWSLAGEIGGIWPLGRAMIQPSIGLTYIDGSIDGFTETGAGAFDLTVADSDAESFSSLLALRVFGRWTMGKTPVLPDLKLGWRHEFEADRHSFTAFFAEDSTVLFPIVSSAINEDAFVFSGGVTAGLTNNFEVFVDVNGNYGSDASTTNASLGGRITW